MTRRSTSSFTRNTLAAASMVLAFGSSAIADQDEPFAFELDVTSADTEAGAREIYDSISREANRLCVVHQERPWVGRHVVLECRQSIIDQVVAQINAPLVTALHTDTVRAPQLAIVER